MPAPVTVRSIDLRICRHKAVYRGEYTTGDSDPEENVWLVAGVSDGTHVGYGECVPTSLYYPPGHVGRVDIDEWAELQALARPLIGQDARQLSRLIPEDPSSDDGNSIRDVLDFALHDLVGRALNVPAAVLLGGVGRRRVRSSYVVHTGTPDEMAELAAEMNDRFGIQTFKLKPIGTLEGDEATLRLMREQISGELHVYADANYALSITDPDAVVDYLNRLHALGLEVYEDPIDADFATYRYIRERTPVHLMIDDKARTPEAIMQILQERAADQINIHANWSGGFAPGLRKAHLAATGGLPTMVGSTYYLGPAVAAYQILSSVLPLEAPCEQNFDDLLGEGISVLREPFAFENGSYTLPDAPGLGIDVDPTKLDAVTETQLVLD
jgi:L-alanine-DL-glutamate epimerase-like enolase superfamily enzyme